MFTIDKFVFVGFVYFVTRSITVTYIEAYKSHKTAQTNINTVSDRSNKVPKLY